MPKLEVRLSVAYTLAGNLLPFLRWRRRVTRASLRGDAVAGIVGALIVLPQGVAFATLAGLPPQFGLYCALLPAIVAALWGSSWHQISGPTNALSLVVFATIAPFALPQSPDYILLVLTLALLVGILQLAMGIARLGALVNFISHTVIIGFTAGAALLIVSSQLRHFFGVPIPSGAGFFASIAGFLREATHINPWITATAAVTLFVAIVAKRSFPRVPYMIVAMVGGSLFGWALTARGIAIPTVGAIPGGLPPLSVPSFDPDTWRKLLPAALAVAVLGLTEAISIARAIAAKSGQRIDSNQEFIGQGLANIVAAFGSAYPCSGSFNRSGVNFAAGAQTPLAAVFSALFLLAILFAVAPLASYLPLATMAALLMVVAWGLIDIPAMLHIARTNRSELVVLAFTFLATLAVQLEFAIFVGVLVSLLVYLHRTTRPKLTRVVPDAASAQRRFLPPTSSLLCPQLEILRVDGSLFFGAVEHVRDALESARTARPHVRHWLLVGTGINFIDVAGCQMLAVEAKQARDRGGALYFANFKPTVRATLDAGGFAEMIGADRIFADKSEAIRAIYGALDAATCATCTARIFRECQQPLPDSRLRITSAGRSP